MFSDPPHKKGYYSNVPTDNTFNKWKQMQDYQLKVTRLNDKLEQEEKF